MVGGRLPSIVDPMSVGLGTVPRVSMFAKDLRSWHPKAADQESLKREYLDFLQRLDEGALDRDGGREHLTASCFVFTPDLENVLLCFHKKGRFWVQVGGHIEPEDVSVPVAALREAVEESGIQAIELISTTPIDLDRHDLGTGFFRCDVHWDVGFAATAVEDAIPVTSDESDDVRWWPLGSLPSEIPHGLAARVNRIVAAIRDFH